MTARQIGGSPVRTAAANSSGGMIGKMIDAQSIVVASVATGGQADNRTQVRSCGWCSGTASRPPRIMGVLVMLQACVFKGMIVVPPAVAP